jgi:hypothetical protein
MKNISGFHQLGCIVLLCMLPFFSNAQQVEKSISTSKGNIGFLEYKPTDYKPTGTYKYPLIIFLHGLGEIGNGTTDLYKVAINGTPKNIRDGHNMKFDWNGVSESFIVLSPQLNTGHGWWQDYYVDEIMEYAKKNLNIDPDRIFLTGLSLGGGGTWYYAGLKAENAKKLAGLVVSCGTCQSVDLCNIAKANLPTWAFHAQNDGTVQASCTIGHIYKINSCGTEVPPYMTIWPDGGHGIWDRVFSTNHNWQNPNVYEWMLGQSSKKTINKRPVAKAGADINITTAQATATLNASQSTDSDGKIVRYVWRKIAGPSTGTIQQPTSTNGITTVTNLTTAGTYSYEVKVIDDRADWTFDTVNVVVVTGSLPQNIPPVAVIANPNQTIQLPTTPITLDASGSYDTDGNIVAYSWTYVSGPTQYTLTQNNQAKATLSNVSTGTYTFRVTVTDNAGSTNSTNIQITFLALPNIAPIANIKTVTDITLPNNNVFLDGSGSSDPEGKTLSYQWSKTSGPDLYQIQSPQSATTTIINLVQGNYTFRLTVKDPEGLEHSTAVSFEVKAQPNVAPVANAGNNIQITAPVSQVILNGSDSYDSDGSITSYRWSQTAGNATAAIETPQQAITSVTNLQPGNYTFTLTVTDNAGAQNSSDVQVEVKAAPVNQLPVIVLLQDVFTIQLPVSSITADASASYDPDGTINSFLYVLEEGKNDFQLQNITPDKVQISNLSVGTYIFKVIAVDDKNGRAEKLLTIHVAAAPPTENRPPVANAGNNQIVPENIGWITLNAENSIDPDGDDLTYSWKHINGPSQFQLNDAETATAQFRPYNTGTFVLLLTVKDSHGAEDSDTLHITVYPLHNPTDNYLPVAIAGNDTTITLPNHSLTLDASASYDPFGRVQAYLWTKISGPDAYNLQFADRAVTELSQLQEGVYQFMVRVWGDEWESTNDTIQITILPEPNAPPVANAGTDQEITLPNNTVSLNGTSSFDPNGNQDIVSYSWKNLTALQATIETAHQALTVVNNLEQGTYEFELTVTDRDGLSDKDTVIIQVRPEPNIAPVANAGADVHIQLPTNTAVLSGAASTDGNTGDGLTYHWKYLGEATSVQITTPSQVSTVINGLVRGIHSFELLVTDEAGASDKDTVLIYVYAEANKPPVAIAGNRQTIQLPVNYVTLNGSQSRDPDGNHTIETYHWSFYSGPGQYTIQQPNNVQTTVTNLREGNYVFALTVKDTANATATDTVHVIVLPRILQAPVANAGTNVTITLPVNSIGLNGTASYDPDGEVEELKYLWQVIPPTGNYQISNATQASSTLSKLEEGIYYVRLTVTDVDGLSSSDTMRIRVNPLPNQVPVAITENDFTLNMESSSFELDGSGSYDPDGENTIAKVEWFTISGPNQPTLSAVVDKSVTVTNFTEGIYVFELVVTDDRNASARARITVTVQPKPAPTNQLPVANAGGNQIITLPTNSIILDGSASRDPDGQIVQYEWRRISGPTQFTLQNNRAAITELNNLIEGTYVFRLTVTDNENAIHFQQITIRVLPAPNVLPIANAGANRTIYLPTNTVVLNGSTSSDPDGQIVGYLWSKISGPAGYRFDDSTIARANVRNLVVGTYEFKLVVTDNLGGKDSASVTIVVQPDPNKPPIANAGPNRTIQLPVNTVQLDGSNSYDPEGDDLIYTWTQVSGPMTATLQNNNTAYAYASDLNQAGIFVFRLKVSDSKGLSATGDISVTVLEKANVLPVARTNKDTVLFEPANALILDAAASTDEDGTIVSYEWSLISGAPALILSPTQVITWINGLKLGDYQFRLKVTDNRGGVAYDTVNIHVLPDPNTKGHLKVYPNPITTGILKVSFKYKELGEAILNVYANDGKIVYKRFINITTYESFWEIPVDQFINGIYTVEIVLPLKHRSATRFIKM